MPTPTAPEPGFLRCKNLPKRKRPQKNAKYKAIRRPAASGSTLLSNVTSDPEPGTPPACRCHCHPKRRETQDKYGRFRGFRNGVFQRPHHSRHILTSRYASDEPLDLRIAGGEDQNLLQEARGNQATLPGEFSYLQPGCRCRIGNCRGTHHLPNCKRDRPIRRVI